MSSAFTTLTEKLAQFEKYLMETIENLRLLKLAQLKLHRYKKEKNGAVALANIFCWAAALLYAQMGAKSVVISPPSLINTVHSQTSLSACLISNCFVFNH